MNVIIDYGVGNLFSLSSSLKYIGAEVLVTGEIRGIEKADRIILPGVGAFKDAMIKLQDSGLIDVIKAQAEQDKPILGICLGMQLFFEKSYEFGEHEGLGLLKGEVRPIAPEVSSDYKIPHIGWNKLHIKEDVDTTLFKYAGDGDYVYFVHSYYACNCYDSIIAVTDYGMEIPAVVGKGNVYATQFHPEKSGDIGLGILRAFAEM